MQHFFIPKRAFQRNEVKIEEAAVIHKIKNVLRFRQGDMIICLNGNFYEYKIKIEEISNKFLKGKVVGVKKNNAELPFNVNLYQAVPKKRELFEQVLQKGTELGVKKFIPILTERTVVKNLGKIERLKRILKESAEQSGRGIIPEINKAVKLKNIKKLEGVSIIADSYIFKPLLCNLLSEIKKASNINIFIGPEGGFTKKEIKYAVGRGIENFSLGPRILRTETAGIAVVSAIVLN